MDGMYEMLWNELNVRVGNGGMVESRNRGIAESRNREIVDWEYGERNMGAEQVCEILIYYFTKKKNYPLIKP